MSISSLFFLFVCLAQTGISVAADKTCRKSFWSAKRGDVDICIFFHKKSEDFSEARKICRSMNAHIITPKASGEFHILSWIDQIQWVGLDDLAKEGVYVWHDDNSTVDENFKEAHFPGESSKSEEEDCIEYVPTKEMLNIQLLSEARCDLERPFFCEHS